jgi:hypothetical protein
VQIQASNRGQLQNGAWQNLTVSNHHKHLRSKVRELANRIRIADPTWLEHWNCARESNFFDLGKLDFLMPSNWPVRLGYYCLQLVTGSHQPF